MTLAARRARLAREVAVQRHIAGKGKHVPPKKLPRQQHPTVLEAEYAKNIIALIIAPARAAFAPLIAALPELVRGAAADRARFDATRADDFNASEPRDLHGRWMGGDFVEEPEISINHGSLGIPRAEMPQIASKDVKEFIDKLAAKGISTESKEMRVADLKPTQAEVNLKKSKEMLAMLPGVALAKPVIASRDGFILDGHHRWAALRISDPNSKIHTHTVDLPIRELLAEAHAFGKTFRKTVNDALDFGVAFARALEMAARGRAREIRAAVRMDELRTDAFNPDEPRDERGRWGDLDEHGQLGSSGGSHALGKHGIQASETLLEFSKRVKREKTERVAKLAAAFKQSPAIIVQNAEGREYLLIKSGEHSNPSEGSQRVSVFLKDGPLSHITRNTDDELHKEIADDYHPVSARPASDADVMAWTSTAEFAEGSDRVAHIQRLNSGRTDAGEGGRVRQLIENAKERMRSAIRPDAVANLARKFAEQTATYQRMQLHGQLKSALGVDVTLVDGKRVASQIDNFVHHNVSLISTIPDKLAGDVEKLVHHAVTTGTLGEDLGDDIQDLTDEVGDRIDISERHARFIARDQAGKFFGQVNKSRQESLGVSSFIWRTSEDERVRGDPDGKYPKAKPSHFELDGQTFDWDDPPQPEGAETTLIPGQDYSCRCSAEPVLDDVLDGDDEEDVETDADASGADEPDADEPEFDDTEGDQDFED